MSNFCWHAFSDWRRRMPFANMVCLHKFRLYALLILCASSWATLWLFLCNLKSHDVSGDTWWSLTKNQSSGILLIVAAFSSCFYWHWGCRESNIKDLIFNVVTQECTYLFSFDLEAKCKECYPRHALGTSDAHLLGSIKILGDENNYKFLPNNTNSESLEYCKRHGQKLHNVRIKIDFSCK